MFVNFADFWKSQKDKSFFKIYDKYYRNISQGNFIGEEFLNFINEKNTKMMKIRLGLD